MLYVKDFPIRNCIATTYELILYTFILHSDRVKDSARSQAVYNRPGVEGVHQPGHQCMCQHALPCSLLARSWDPASRVLPLHNSVWRSLAGNPSEPMRNGFWLIER
jgi:hypothetical protein